MRTPARLIISHRYRYIPLVILTLIFVIAASPSLAQDMVPARKSWEAAKAQNSGQGPALLVVFPRDGAVFSGKTVRFGGATEPGSTMSINGKKIKMLSNGTFAGTIPLGVGRNIITFRSARNGKSTSKTVEVRRTRQLAPLPSQPLAFGAQTPAQPLGHLELVAGEKMTVRCQATQGAEAFFRVGDKEKPYPMRELSVQSGEASVGGIYVGSYTVQERDSFDKARIQITLEINHEGKEQTMTMVPRGTLTTGHRRIHRIVETLENDTGLYTDTSRDLRFLSAAKGTPLLITGRQGEMLRTQLDLDRSAWVPSDRVSLVPDRKKIPVARLQDMELARIADRRDARITFSIKQKEKYQAPLPVRVSLAEEEMALALTVYGMQADEFQIYSQEGKSISKPWQFALMRGVGESDFIQDMQCHPLNEQSTIFRFATSQRIWGYRAVYATDAFDLIIKAPPTQFGGAKGPLAGIKVTLDPGHGGTDAGAVGNSGLQEADANWAIAQRVANLLRAAQAEVYLTRAEDEYVTLTARAERICDSEADVFLSIHCDSVSEYSDPFQSRGTSMFYFYPQGNRLAQQVRLSLADTLQSDVPVLKTAQRDLRVIRACSQMPGALLECLFVSNPNDEMLLMDSAFLDRMSAGIYKGLLTFLQNADSDDEPGKVAKIANRAIEPNRTGEWTIQQKQQIGKIGFVSTTGRSASAGRVVGG